MYTFITSLVLGVWWFAILGPASLLVANPSACTSALDLKFQTAYHDAIFVAGKDPFEALAAEFPERLDYSRPDSLAAFETEAFDLLRVVSDSSNPEPASHQAAVRGFAKKWNLSQQTVQDVLILWRRVFLSDLEAAKDFEGFPRRLAVLRRTRFLNDSQSPLVRRHRFYAANLRNLTVSQMRETLNSALTDTDSASFTDAMVRQQINRLGLSIVEAWDQPISKTTFLNLAAKGLLLKEKTYINAANELIDSAGKTVEQAAHLLGVGEQSLNFIRSHRSHKGRGVSWQRILTYKGVKYVETDLLKVLSGEGMTYQEMADTLNSLANKSLAQVQSIEVIDASSDSYRTTASVAKQLSTLKLTKSHNTQALDVDDPLYGELKKDGNLVDDNAVAYVEDQLLTQSREEIADSLKVTQPGLEGLMARNFMLSTKSNKQGASASTFAESKDSKVPRATLKVIDRVVKELGEVPKASTKPAEKRTPTEKLHNAVYHQVIRFLEKQPEKIKELSLVAQAAVARFALTKRVLVPVSIEEINSFVKQIKYKMPKRYRDAQTDFEKQSSRVNQHLLDNWDVVLPKLEERVREAVKGSQRGKRPLPVSKAEIEAFLDPIENGLDIPSVTRDNERLPKWIYRNCSNPKKMEELTIDSQIKIRARYSNRFKTTPEADQKILDALKNR